MKLRLIPKMEQSAPLVARCRRPFGRWTLLAVFTLIWSLFSPRWPAILGFLALTTAFPGHRRKVVSACGIVLALVLPEWINLPFVERLAAHEGLDHVPRLLVGLVIAAVFFALSVVATLAFRFPHSRMARRPVLAAVLSFCALVGLASMEPLGGWFRVSAWLTVLATGHMLWFFCYTLTDRDARNRDSVPLQTGLWHPAWLADGGSATPIGKGAAYLRKIEARDADELAVTQIKAVKLLIWAFALRLGQVVFVFAVHQRLGVPEFEDAFHRSVTGHPYAWYWNCLSLAAAFAVKLFQMSVWGHQLVACARMAGFRALRNTYRPLESRTLAEFWNRFYFYFKELLVDLFFYPTYLRYFKKHPRVRMAAATMTAAFAGNAIFHFLRDISYVEELGWWRAITSFQTYLFYTFILGAGISISQLRAKRKDDPSRSWLRRRFVPVLSVAGFYCVVHVFDDTNRTYGLREHFVFVGRLFGL